MLYNITKDGQSFFIEPIKCYVFTSCLHSLNSRRVIVESLQVPYLTFTVRELTGMKKGKIVVRKREMLAGSVINY